MGADGGEVPGDGGRSRKASPPHRRVAVIDVAEELKHFRWLMRFSQRDAAAAFKVPHTTWSGWERGRGRPDSRIMKVILAARKHDAAGDVNEGVARAILDALHRERS